MEKSFLEYSYHVLVSVPADVVRLKKDTWFCELDRGQIARVEGGVNICAIKEELNEQG